MNSFHFAAAAAFLALQPAHGAPFGSAPVQAPFLSYTGKSEVTLILPVTTQPLAYAGKQAPPLPGVTTVALAYQGRGDPKGIATVNATPLSYKGKQ
ncbi:hypothetical protein FN976_22980 [Caenimonas sedimenti]|uniref:Uncharacterized protein n=1 Tax=Caenimonas sedimenti TaxID=2596921 RepID=A0A562ZJJ9_9BURK|nr:hypothetical protein [Caenimonas sedimenti]TWO68498.1 hypothetical protein FN976_22980 [Caenimonas sedimenti]